MRTSYRTSPTTCVICGAERREPYLFALQLTTPISFASEADVTFTSMLPASILVERCSTPVPRLGAEACIPGMFPGRLLHSHAANFATDWRTQCFTSKSLALRSRPILMSFRPEALWKAKCFPRLSIMHQMCLSSWLILSCARSSASATGSLSCHQKGMAFDHFPWLSHFLFILLRT